MENAHLSSNVNIIMQFSGVFLHTGRDEHIWNQTLECLGLGYRA